MTKETRNYVTDTKVIDVKLRNQINSFLKSSGYQMAGGSIVTIEGGKVQYCIGIDGRYAATIGSISKRLKEHFGFEHLIVNGVPV